MHRPSALAFFVAAVVVACTAPEGPASTPGARETSLCAGQEATQSSLRIAPADEPGEPMVITGQVWVGKRRLPVPGARLLVYHTNADGLYARDGSGYAGAYLCGTLRTDADGAYRLETIRPGAPPWGALAHVHFELTVPWGDRFHEGLSFEDDPRRGRAPVGESWEEIRPVLRGEDGVQRVERNFWIRY